MHISSQLYTNVCVCVCVCVCITCHGFLVSPVYVCMHMRAHTGVYVYYIYMYYDYSLHLSPLFFSPYVSSFSDIIIYTHIREELCEAALKSDSAAVHDGTRRRILIVAHRCVFHGVCVDRSIHLCQFINTPVFWGAAQSQLPITT